MLSGVELQGSTVNGFGGVTQRAIRRAVAGALKAGLEIGRVEVDQRAGRIVIVSGARAAQAEDELEIEMKAWRTSRGEI